MTGARMSMNRVIHGAIRRDLDRFVAALDTFPTGDQRRADELATAWQHFAEQLHDHHTGEHDTAWPALQRVGVSEGTLSAMDSEHDAMAQAITVAGETLSALRHHPGQAQADHAYAAFERLREVTVGHLDHEEAELEELYLAHQDHPAMLEMSRAFRRRSGPAAGGRLFAWLLDGATAEQRVEIERTVPAPVLKALVAVFGRRYRRTVAPTWSH